MQLLFYRGKLAIIGVNKFQQTHGINFIYVATNGLGTAVSSTMKVGVHVHVHMSFRLNVGSFDQRST